MNNEMSSLTPTIESLRSSLDNLDCAILTLLAERFKVTNQVGILKKSQKLPAVDLAREEFQLKRIHDIARTSGLDPVIAERIWRLVVDEVVKIHKRIEGE